MTQRELTFCGDLDMGTGDCDLMFLAEEPADSHMKEREGKFKMSGFVFFHSPG